MLKKIIRNKSFLLLWTSQLISNLGNAIYLIALPWLILDITGSKFQSSLVYLNSYIPAILFGFYIGHAIDKYNYKILLIISDIARSLLILSIPLFLILDLITPIILSGITFLVSTFNTLHYPSRDCIIPSIIDKSQLKLANSCIIFAAQLAHFIGPLFAGLGVAIFGLTHLFSVNAVLFLFSIIIISFISINQKNKNTHIEKDFIKLIKDTLDYIIKKKELIHIIFLTFVNNLFIMGPAFLGLAIFVREVLREDISVYAFLEASMAIGMILGSIIFELLSKRFKLINILFAGILIDGISFSLLYFADTNYISFFILFIHGIGIPLIIISRTTLIQLIVPNYMRGRIFSIIYMSVMSATAISIGITGLVLEYFSAQIVFLIIGICASLSIIFVNCIIKINSLEYKIN